MDDPDPELGALLRARRPAPDREFVESTERRLLRPRRAPLRWPSPALRLGTAFAVGLAALAVALSLAGVGPLADGDRAVQAEDDCRTVRVTRVERVPRVVTRPDGQPDLVYERREVQRLERRC